MREIVKVQRPLQSNQVGAPWLIYAEGRKNIETVPEKDVSSRVRTQMKRDYKAYFWADWDAETNTWDVHSRVPDEQGF